MSEHPDDRPRAGEASSPPVSAGPGRPARPADPIDPDVARLRIARPSRLADAVALALHPVPVASVLLAAVGWCADGPRGLAWALVAAALCAVLPLLVILAMVGRGLLDDAQVVRRAQRGRAMAVGMGAQVVGLAALSAAGAPRPVLALVVAMLAGVVVIAVVTRVAKASVHTAVVADSVPVLAQAAGAPWGAVAALAVPAVAWARVRAGRHTLPQVLLGAALGAVVVGPVFMAFA